MEQQKYPKNGKFKAFLKRNVYYIIMGVCILAIGAMITVAVLAKEKPGPADNNINPGGEDPGGEDPVVNPEPIVFDVPVDNATIIQDYTMTSLVWWDTLRHYAVHNGIDYAAAEGAAVKAAYGGVVTSVDYDMLKGFVVTIDHGDGLVTSYGSLADSPVVTVGQTVEKGATLGIIGNTATNELHSGAHVHFVVKLNGAVVSPYDYLPEGDK
jgi:Membrane proteins related to metalloendopeptidases